MLAETTFDAFATGADSGASVSRSASGNRGPIGGDGVVGCMPDREGTQPTAAVVGA